MNFVGFVMGVEDSTYSVTGSSPVLATTGRDTTPPQTGWRWAVIQSGLNLYALGVSIILFVLALVTPLSVSWLFGVIWFFAASKALGALGFISYWSGWDSSLPREFYLGWRPASGGFGFKLVFPKAP